MVHICRGCVLLIWERTLEGSIFQWSESCKSLLTSGELGRQCLFFTTLYSHNKYQKSLLGFWCYSVIFNLFSNNVVEILLAEEVKQDSSATCKGSKGSLESRVTHNTSSAALELRSIHKLYTHPSVTKLIVNALRVFPCNLSSWISIKVPFLKMFM